MDELDVERYSLATEDEYRWQQGTLSAAGFIPITSTYLNYGFGPTSFFPIIDEIAAVDDRYIIELSLWNSLAGISKGILSKFRRSSTIYYIRDVPYVEVAYVGAGGAGSYLSSTKVTLDTLVFAEGDNGAALGRLVIFVGAKSTQYTGTLHLVAEGKVVALKGKLVETLKPTEFSLVFSREESSSAPSLDFELTVTASGLSGDIYRNDELYGSLARGARQALPPQPYGAGAYTLALLATESSITLPRGAGHASATIAASNAQLRLSGRLPDGTPLTGAFSPAADRSYRVWLNPYGKRPYSYLGGTLALQAHPDTARFPGRYYIPADTASLVWGKARSPARPLDASYREGFATNLGVLFDPWIPPAKKSVETSAGPIVAATLAQRLALTQSATDPVGVNLGYAVDFWSSLGALRESLPTRLLLSSRGAFSLRAVNGIAPSNPTDFSMKVVPATGAVSGAFTLRDPVPGSTRTIKRRVTFTGTLRQSPGERDLMIGYGQFLYDPWTSDASTEKTSGLLVFEPTFE